MNLNPDFGRFGPDPRDIFAAARFEASRSKRKVSFDRIWAETKQGVGRYVDITPDGIERGEVLGTDASPEDQDYWAEIRTKAGDDIEGAGVVLDPNGNLFVTRCP